jgi:hypothetical protein
MTNDTMLGVMRHAGAGCPEFPREIESEGLRHFQLG